MPTDEQMVARVIADQKKENMVKQAFTSQELSTLANACHVAARQFREDAKVMEEARDTLKNGGSIPMFADGEAGARAADRTAKQFIQQAEDTEQLATYFE